MIARLSNMQGRPSHIRDVGPHPHDWATARQDSAGVSQECRTCGTRRYTPGDTPIERAWLAGGDWLDAKPAAEPRAAEEPKKPRGSSPPRKG